MTDHDGRVNWDDYVTLRDYFDAKIKHLEEEMNLKVDSLKEATTIAKCSMDERLAGMNEFRESLKDQNTLFVPRGEYNSIIDRLCSDIASLKESRAKLEGKAEQSQVNIVLLISIIGLVLGFLGLIAHFV